MVGGTECEGGTWRIDVDRKAGESDQYDLGRKKKTIKGEIGSAGSSWSVQRMFPTWTLICVVWARRTMTWLELVCFFFFSSRSLQISTRGQNEKNETRMRSAHNMRTLHRTLP